ncbi:MAG: MBL fold metallo-hydrolase [Candidatus Pacebacteria bacterium]|nr:MBL fold metallo-hydrolase [Candidatus Paceibacterota bacterium]
MSGRNKNFYLVVFLVGAGIFFSVPFLPDKKLELTFCDVGQGDAILIQQGENQVLIDGGPSANQLLECLAKVPPWDRRIELVVLTHPDSDHLTGLIEVFKRFQVNQLVANSIVKESGLFWQFYQEVLAEPDLVIYSPRAGDRIRLGKMEFLVLWPEERPGDSRLWKTQFPLPGQNGLGDQITADSQMVSILGAAAIGKTNETSVVLKFSYGEFDALLTGDIGFDSEKKIDFPEVEVLKVPHHGSKYSTSDELVRESSPELAVISVGRNSFGHPTDEVLNRLNEKGIKVKRTDEEGEIEIVTNGKSYWLK